MFPLLAILSDNKLIKKLFFTVIEIECLLISKVKSLINLMYVEIHCFNKKLTINRCAVC